MKSAFGKSAIRAIKSSYTRFISIIVISFLGSTIFAGLAAISPNMRLAGDTYYDEQNVMDVRLLSTFGFTQEDVDVIRNAEGILGVMPSYTVDSAGAVEDKDYTFRINALPESNNASNEDYINQLALVEGRWPEKDNEAIVIKPAIGLKNITLESYIELDKASNETLEDTLGCMNYKIVGIAESPYYLFFMQGNTTVGNGMISYVVYVPHNNFTVDGYTDLYVTIKDAKSWNTFQDEYFDHTEAVVNQLKDIKKDRQTLRFESIQTELTDAKKEYNDSEKEVSEKLQDAREQLDEGNLKIADAKDEYDSGLSTYHTEKEDAYQKLQEAKEQLDEAILEIEDGEQELASKKGDLEYAQAQLRVGRAQLDQGWEEYNSGYDKLQNSKAELFENKKLLDAGQLEYDAGVAQAEAATGMTIDQIKNNLPYIKSEIDTSKTQLDGLQALKGIKDQRDAFPEESEEYQALNEGYQQALAAAGMGEEQADALYEQLGAMAEQIAAAQIQYDQLVLLIESKVTLEESWALYNDGKEKIDAAEGQMEGAKQQLNGAEAEYNTNLELVNDGLAQLKKAEETLAEGRAEYEEGLAEYTSQKEKADREFANAKTELDDAAVSISEAETELIDNEEKYVTESKDAKEKLEDAKLEIADNEKKLSDMGDPEWYVLDRNLNESFVAYYSDTQRMHNLATVFPIIFFLVAVLVCLTTMTRMVDEDRTLIGTFEALGYSNSKIAGRYLRYASSASFIGSIIGVLVGFELLPSVVWAAYGIIYELPELKPQFFIGIAFLSIFATVSVITISTGVAIRKTLQETPAELMRPKAPKSGKRVFLEYIKPLWNRLTFTQKVTIRNLGLNKRRLVMTLIGILGCTSLVVTAFGAKEAVRGLVDRQFIDVFHYNISVDYNDGIPSEDLASRMDDKTYVKDQMQVHRKSADASIAEDEDKTYSAYIVSPDKANRLTDFITFTDAKKKKEIPFTDQSVIINEKLAIKLKLKAGDTITLKYLDGDEQYTATVTGVMKNYTFNYVYLGKDIYYEVFGELPEYNQYIAITQDGYTDDNIKEYLSGASGIGPISFTDDLMGNVATTIKSVDTIIWILIIAAGMLAFVVLYNLTNINISERQRELATLKVLGFYDKETYNYIFRETIILSVIGCFLGLFAGVFLYRAVIATVEPDMIMMTRDLTWQGYVGAVIITMSFTWIVNQFIKPKIKNIDMLESLKSVD